MFYEKYEQLPNCDTENRRVGSCLSASVTPLQDWVEYFYAAQGVEPYMRVCTLNQYAVCEPKVIIV